MKLLLLLSTIGSSNAEPPAVMLELEEGFYHTHCDRGFLTVTSKTYECPETGLYRITAEITVSGRTSEVELRNADLCKESLWIAEVPQLICTNESKDSKVEYIKVHAHVDPISWKEALDR